MHPHRALHHVFAALVSTVFISSFPALAAGPANAPAAQFGFNYANTNQSTQYGPITQPTISWTHSIGMDGWTSAPRSLSLSSDGILYTPGSYALNAKTGALLWHVPDSDASSLALADNGAAYAAESWQVYTRASSGGGVLWTGPITGSSSLDPIKIGPDGTLYSTTFSGKFYAFAPDGQLKWSVSTGSPQYGEISHIPAIDSSNNVYYAGVDGLRSLDSSGLQRWLINYNAFRSSRVMLTPSGNVIWQRDNLVELRNPVTGALTGSFASNDVLKALDSEGNLYFSSSNEVLKTTQTGQIIWRYAHSYMEGPITVDAAGSVYCGDESGNIIGLTRDGIEMWRLDVTNTYPILAETSIIIGPDRSLYLAVLNTGKIMALAPSVPEPATLALLAIPALLLVNRRRPASQRQK